MKWTDKQREAIDARGKNMLVAAAAGSGKTAVLVERIKQLILKDHVSIDEMLIVTFTNAAAAEMKEKIIGAITRELECNQGDAAFLRKQLNIIYKSNISTFHSFALEVIRRYFYIISIEPNFKICDEAENIILRTEAMEELFETLFKEEDPGFIRFLNKYAGSKNESGVKTMVDKAYMVLRSIPDYFTWLENSVDTLKKDKEEFLRGVVAREIKLSAEKNLLLALHSFQRVEACLEEAGLPELAVKARLDVEQLLQIQESLPEKSLEVFLEEVGGVTYQRFTVKKEEKEAYEEVKERVEKIRDKGKGYLKKIKEAYTVRSLDEYVEELQATHDDARYLQYLIVEFHAIFKRKKEEKNLIDFNDIEHFALEILKDVRVAGEYRDKFRHIFIDEYQDSNLLQEALISAIKRENNVFMVGDVKQSIYKFRLAEPEIFMEKYERFKRQHAPENITIDLNQNFRSKGKVIDSVNQIFSAIMDNYDEDAALYKGVDYTGRLEYPVELHIMDEQISESAEVDEEIRDLKMAELEAHTAARLIKEQLGKEIFDVRQNRIRQIRKRDVVILLRATKNYADKFYKIFTEENIPAHMDDSEGYFDTLEIEIMLNLLRIIDNKQQDIPLISVLHSPIMNFTLEDLANIRSEQKKGSFYSALERYHRSGEREALRLKIGDALKKIAEWQQESKYMPLEDFIWKLIRETGYYTYVGALPAGIQRQANLRLLIDKSIQFQQGSLKGLYGFISYVEAVKARSVRTGQISLVGERDDVVRIMTIHKSKGLEFPVVLVAGLGKQFNQSKDTATLDLHKDLGISISYIDNDRKYYTKTILQNAIREKSRQLDMEEEIRILYVAFTRAMDKLILLGTVKNSLAAKEKYDLSEKGDSASARCYLDMIVPATEGGDIPIIYHSREEILPVNSDANTNKKVVRDLLEGDISDMEEGEMAREIGNQLGYVYPYLPSVNLKSKWSVSELTKRKQGQDHHNLALRRPLFQPEDKKFTPAEKGTLMHDFMMRLDFAEAYRYLCESEDRLLSHMEERLVELVADGCFTELEKKEIQKNKIVRFFKSPLGIRAAQSVEVYKEAPFSILHDMNGEEIIVQGIIDCYFKEADGYVLIDYKTNSLMDPENPEELKGMKALYEEQISLYRKAIQLSRGLPVKEAYLYLFSADIEMNVS